MMESIREMVSLLAARLSGARDARSALETIAETLGARWDLWRASVIVFTRRGTGRFVANWPDDTRFDEGLEVRLDLTPDALALVGELIRGRPILVRPDQIDLGLLGSLLRMEGVSSAVGLPLRDDEGAVIGVLALGSYRREAFAAEDVARLEQLTPAVERTLVALASAE